jgi:hypothetical protein
MPAAHAKQGGMRVQHVMTRSLLALCALLPAALVAQDVAPVHDRPGMVSLGGRSSISLFNNGERDDVGMGTGGQFRIRISDRVNTDWFYDYFRGNIGEHGHRSDQHIGWSVLFYLLPSTERPRRLQPYALAGHCFDHTLQQANNAPAIRAERWSSAVQAGLGTHLNLSDRFDLSLVGQYMIHLGNDVHMHQHSDGRVYFEEHGAGLEGHLLLHLSFNYKLFRLW